MPIIKLRPSINIEFLDFAFQLLLLRDKNPVSSTKDVFVCLKSQSEELKTVLEEFLVVVSIINRVPNIAD